MRLIILPSGRSVPDLRSFSAVRLLRRCWPVLWPADWDISQGHSLKDVGAISDAPGHSYQSAQTIVKHYRSRNAARADAVIDRLVDFISRGGVQ
jgi:hypothetical protein